MKKLLLIASAAAAVTALAACEDELRTVDYNLDRAANNFEVRRRVVFVNGITGEYLLEIEGICAIEHQAAQLEVTCEHEKNTFKRHFLGLSDNVTYFVEQVGTQYANPYHYRVVFKPQSIVPDIDVRGDLSETPLTDGRR